MVIWLIPQSLAKAALSDPLPEAVRLGLAVEDPQAHPKARLYDDARLDWDQRQALAFAVCETLYFLALGRPVVLVCQQGHSRAPMVACLAQALWQRKSFYRAWQELRDQDSGVVSESPLAQLAGQVFWPLFSERDSAS